MTFTQAITSGFKKCVNVSGRASRSEYWYWVLFFVLYITADAVIFDAFFKGQPPFHGFRIPFDLLGAVFVLLGFPATIAVTIRRLHDVNRRGWWLLIGVIPVLGLICWLLWLSDKGVQGMNRFGADPLPMSDVPRRLEQRWRRIIRIVLIGLLGGVLFGLKMLTNA